LLRRPWTRPAHHRDRRLAPPSVRPCPLQSQWMRASRRQAEHGEPSTGCGQTAGSMFRSEGMGHNDHPAVAPGTFRCRAEKAGSARLAAGWRNKGPMSAHPPFTCRMTLKATSPRRHIEPRVRLLLESRHRCDSADRVRRRGPGGGARIERRERNGLAARRESRPVRPVLNRPSVRATPHPPVPRRTQPCLHLHGRMAGRLREERRAGRTSAVLELAGPQGLVRR
jgi:hypothetical protein